MTISVSQKNAIEELIDVILNTTSAGRGKRKLADMFLELVDKEAWPEYYELIPEPRCLSRIKENLEKNKYKDPVVVFKDLRLVFLNALFYNEEGSQIAKDAATLKGVLESEWQKRPALPTPPTTPPIAAPQAPKKSAPLVETPAPRPVTPEPVVDVLKSSPPPPSPFQQHPSSPEAMDVDFGSGSPEPDGVIEDMTRDAESDNIVRQLEYGLPRWVGFDDKGWIPERHPDALVEIVVAIKSYKDVIGNRVAAVLDNLPEESTMKDLSFNFPLSLKIIEARVRAKHYQSTKDFDLECARLFEKGRRWYEITSEQYGNVLLLQRLYQALTSPSPPSGPPYTSQSNFASLRAGPGTARPLHAPSGDADSALGVTTFRVSSKDRSFVDEVNYRGFSIRLGDWLHLANPDDPSRPIVAQVFKVWVSEETTRKGQPGVTVSWYYRPEQTIHPAHRQFWEGEVFKTSHFADHPVEDIIEKIAVQFTARHIRGRPRPPYWYPGWPLYVCDSRYNDRERVFVKIKNWNSCVPEEVRKTAEFMPIYPFERTVYPRRHGSPFLVRTNTKGRAKLPGGIGDSVERADGERIEGGGTGRKRPRRPNGVASTPAGAGVNGGIHMTTIPPTNGIFDHVPYQPPQQLQQQMRRTEDRSIVTAAGGAANVGGAFVLERLPQETARHFDRDPDTNEVLWFSGPPIDLARHPPPQFSLTYLHHLAMQRKREREGRPNEHDRPSKRTAPTVSETLEAVWEQLQK